MPDNAATVANINFAAVGLSKPNDHLGLPAQVWSWITEYGWAAARQLVLRQKLNADTDAAFTYFSAVLAAMDALQNGTLPPSIPPLGPQTDVRVYPQAITIPISIAGRMTP
jgi:hypothetical protein